MRDQGTGRHLEEQTEERSASRKRNSRLSRPMVAREAVVRLQDRSPKRRGGCATVLIWVGILLVVGLLLSFAMHVIVAIAVVCIVALIIAAIWAVARRWL